ncbi:MAG: sulfatase-like hydrolase/transferase, partial [Planctomycetota bacterium]
MIHRIALITLGVLVSSSASLAADKRPNFLFILTDDQAPQSLKAYGNKVCQTPNIDRLASEGMVLDGAHHMGAWIGAVCTPSRHMIMSGRTVWHLPSKRRARKPRKNAKPNKNAGKKPAPGRNPNSSNPKLVPPNLAEFTMPAVFNGA